MDKFITINPIPLSVEKFTKEDIENVEIIVKSLYKMIYETDATEFKNTVKLVKKCLEFENKNEIRNYYYFVSKSLEFKLEKEKRINDHIDDYNILCPKDSDYTREELDLIKEAGDSILDIAGRDKNEIGALIININVIKRNVPICTYYRNDVYVLK